jgi:hypothetical protein
LWVFDRIDRVKPVVWDSQASTLGFRKLAMVEG